MNIYDVLDLIEKQPQTYSTILGEIYTNCSQDRVLRRKLNKEFRNGVVFKTLIPDSLFLYIMYYSPTKQYTIFFVRSMLKTHVYYAELYVDKDIKFELHNVYELDGCRWKQINDIMIDKENLIKVI